MEHIVIVGAGFAGIQAAQSLTRNHNNSMMRVTLINSENYTTFIPLLAEVVGASILPGQALAPVRHTVPGARVIMGYVTEVDHSEQRIHYDDGNDVQSLKYDQLVMACGGRAKLDMIPGMSENALPLKMLGDALKLRNRVLSRLEQAENREDPATRDYLLSFAVVGGGFSGVEVTGEVIDFIRHSLKYYPGLEWDQIRVHLIHADTHLLPEMDPKLGRHAEQSLRRRGVRVHLETRVDRGEENGLVVAGPDDSGLEKLEAGTLVCTIGTQPSELVSRAGLPLNGTRISTRPDMSVTDHNSVWAVGDCASIINTRDKSESPPTAQFAVEQGKQLAANIERQVRGEATQPFSYRERGMLATVGHCNGVGRIRSFRISGVVAWFLWRGFYLSRMPTLARKVRLVFEWTWGVLFPLDIAQLRFTVSSGDARDSSVRDRD